jgi:hypothetical protein
MARGNRDRRGAGRPPAERLVTFIDAAGLVESWNGAEAARRIAT